MQSKDLSEQQVEAIRAKVQPMLAYLTRLKKRMHSQRFPPSDPLLLAVCRADDAVHDLHIRLHYLTCSDVTGRDQRY